MLLLLCVVVLWNPLKSNYSHYHIRYYLIFTCSSVKGLKLFIECVVHILKPYKENMQFVILYKYNGFILTLVEKMCQDLAWWNLPVKSKLHVGQVKSEKLLSLGTVWKLQYGKRDWTLQDPPQHYYYFLWTLTLSLALNHFVTLMLYDTFDTFTVGLLLMQNSSTGSNH